MKFSGDTDPVEIAKGFAAAGAEWMHLTDINALAGDGDNNELSEKIIRSAGIPVQFGGGFRSREAVERWIDKGAGRIVVSTMAIQTPDLVKQLARAHPDQIVVALDHFEGSVMSHGWRHKSANSQAFPIGIGGRPIRQHGPIYALIVFWQRGFK